MRGATSGPWKEGAPGGELFLSDSQQLGPSERGCRSQAPGSRSRPLADWLGLSGVKAGGAGCVAAPPQACCPSSPTPTLGPVELTW